MEVAAFAHPTISCRRRDPSTLIQVMTRLVYPIVQVGGIIPQPVDTDAHTRRNEIPYVGFPQEDSVTMKLRQVATGAWNPGGAAAVDFHVDPLEMRAQENRSSGVRRACQETLGAPQEQVGTGQPTVTCLLPSGSAIVFTSLAMRHAAQCQGTEVPNDAGG